MSEKDTTIAVAPRFYTLQELADLGVGSESTLRKAIKEGRLSFHHITYVAYITMRTIVTCIDLERCDKLEPIHRVELLKVGTPCYLHGERRSLGRYEIGRLRVAKPPHHPRRDAMVPKFEPRPPMGNSASRAALNRGC